VMMVMMLMRRWTRRWCPCGTWTLDPRGGRGGWLCGRRGLLSRSRGASILHRCSGHPPLSIYLSLPKVTRPLPGMLDEGCGRISTWRDEMREYRVEMTAGERFAKVALMDGNQMTPKINQTNRQDKVSGKNQGEMCRNMSRSSTKGRFSDAVRP